MNIDWIEYSVSGTQNVWYMTLITEKMVKYRLDLIKLKPNPLPLEEKAYNISKREGNMPGIIIYMCALKN